MFASIKTKLTAIIGVASLVTLSCVYLAIVYFYNQNITLLIQNALRQTRHLMAEQINFESQKMGTALEVLRNDQELIDPLVRRDRTALYHRTEALFANLRAKYGITHLYFHLPDGTTFLRVHKPALYGDRNTRPTFQEARRTGSTSSGLELGQTAFALRVVTPCYQGGKLVGYLELGEEIEHFLNFLKGVTGDEYALVVEKSNINRTAWEAARKANSQQNNWDLMQAYLCIGSTSSDLLKPQYMNDTLVRQFSRQEGFEQGRLKAVSRVLAGLPLAAPDGTIMGTLITQIDVSQHAAVLHNLRNYSTVMVLVLFLATFAGIVFFSGRIIIRPLGRISKAAQIFAGGELKEHRIEVSSRDEIGLLAESINEMAVQLDEHYTAALERSRELEQLNRSLEELATTDGLTGLWNHRYFYLKLNEEVKRARRYGRPLSLIMADIDHFKLYNDAYGHVSGDALLKEVADVLMEHARENDVVARYGGEEFAIILPETVLQEALAIAERIRSLIDGTRFHYPEADRQEHLTVSFGVAEYHSRVADAREFVAMADSALYRAKRGGRNRVEPRPGPECLADPHYGERTLFDS